ncbi:MAG: YebC/PmpR family DNA-binding transcriptional regulator [Gammaproteobacteria bacterium]|nr:YebC/PmpR family DNA-binding transcriptional regulator [Gammaproteobacteria bacterium]
MAGHSKWANIQHRKGRQDAKRGKLFTKLIREVTIAAKLGGGDPDANPRLRAAIDSAKSQSMPKDTIERAVKRGAGDDESGNLEEIRYEGYGPGGVAVMVDCMTDNKNRTVAEVRHAFSKYGGNLGTDGSVSYIFNKIGLISYPSGTDEDALMEAALEAGAEDIISNEDGSIDVITNPDQLVDVKDALVEANHQPENAEVTMQATTSSSLEQKGAESMLRLLDVLEDLDDVQKVYSNAEISDEILAQLSD